jgi:aldose 1-epimerase
VHRTQSDPDDASFGLNTFQVLGSHLKPGCAEQGIADGLDGPGDPVRGQVVSPQHWMMFISRYRPSFRERDAKRPAFCYNARAAAKAVGKVLIALLLVSPASAQYSARSDGDVVHLEDSAHQIRVSIVPSVGNVAFEMRVEKQNLLYFPYADIVAFRSQPRLSGIPFLGPWANRLDEQAFYANGKRYIFNTDLGNVSGAHPIHGFLSFTDKWTVTEVKADKKAAWVTSRLDFYREPSWMAQFPFAHTIEMTYQLAAGVLEVKLRLQNLSSEPMPVSIGFHPYFQLTDSPREDWTIRIGAKKHWLLNGDKIPNGETVPIEQMFPDPNRIELQDYSLDDVFSDLVRDADGRALMRVKGKAQQLEVLFGPKYNTVVVFSPQPRDSANRAGAIPNFICFEPMAGITDAMNMAYRGLYHELQMLPPGKIWQESFWIRPTGF